MKKKPEDIFREHGGHMRMSQAISCGISRYMLYSMRDKGIVEQVSRGIYRLADMPVIDNPDLITVSLRYPSAVICLTSALAYHEVTTQIPHKISVAIPRKHRSPALKYPPVTVHRFSQETYNAGIEEHCIDGVSVRIYCVAKTVADCFKFRNKIGLDIAIEALRDCIRDRKATTDDIWKYAVMCRVSNVIKPYMEAFLFT